MTIRIREFANRLEMEDFCNDVIINKVPINPIHGINVRNLTLTFTTPAKTVTFPDTVAYEDAKPTAIVDQINTQVAAGTAQIRSYGYGDPLIALVNGGDVYTGGTASSILGLPTGTVGANALAISAIAQVILTSQQRYMLVYEV